MFGDISTMSTPSEEGAAEGGAACERVGTGVSGERRNEERRGRASTRREGGASQAGGGWTGVGGGWSDTKGGSRWRRKEKCLWRERRQVREGGRRRDRCWGRV